MARPAIGGSPFGLDALEPRRLLSGSFPTAAEQYLVELVNRARANPAAEAARDGIDLNEGLPAGTISAAAKQPLAINPYLTTSSTGHSQWMIDNGVFSHTGAGGSNPGQRMTSAGYPFSGGYGWGENIAYRSSGSSVDPAVVSQLHDDLFVDTSVTGRGHRLNLMNGAYREVGAGVVAGKFTTYPVNMLTEDFAYTGAAGSGPFLTGVAYSDAVNANHFYDVGEGLGGVSVVATRLSDGATFSTTTWASGGYSLSVPAGTYRVTASGAGLNGTVTDASVAVAGQNVKVDFTPGAGGPAPDTTPPRAVLGKLATLKVGGSRSFAFKVTYTDNVAVKASTIGAGDVIVTGPHKFSAPASLTSVTPSGDGKTLTATYWFHAPGTWDPTDDGTYVFSLQARQVSDTSGNYAAAAKLGSFVVSIPAAAVRVNPAAQVSAPAPANAGAGFFRTEDRDPSSLFA